MAGDLPVFFPGILSLSQPLLRETSSRSLTAIVLLSHSSQSVRPKRTVYVMDDRSHLGKGDTRELSKIPSPFLPLIRHSLLPLWSSGSVVPLFLAALPLTTTTDVIVV
jgi:hypothetical protein